MTAVFADNDVGYSDSCVGRACLSMGIGARQEFMANSEDYWADD